MLELLDSSTNRFFALAAPQERPWVPKVDFDLAEGGRPAYRGVAIGDSIEKTPLKRLIGTAQGGA